MAMRGPLVVPQHRFACTIQHTSHPFDDALLHTFLLSDAPMAIVILVALATFVSPVYYVGALLGLPQSAIYDHAPQHRKGRLQEWALPLPSLRLGQVLNVR
jgi:hypothetical protein